jgi:hypothetical protein
MQKKARGLSLAKILHTSGINRLINRLPSNNPVRFCHDRAASALCRLAHRSLQSREDRILENLALRQQLLTFHAKQPRRRLGSLDRSVLGLATKAVVGVEETTPARHPPIGAGDR